MAHFEIEIKSLLGEKKNADELLKKMMELDPECVVTSKNKQLNHYFEGGDVKELFSKVHHLFSGEEHEKLEKVIDRGESFSVRTRQRNEEVLLVVKAAIDDGASENTVKRIEFEEPVNLSLADLDALVTEAGFTYQAKWSREREEYSYKSASVCLDKNAGYGYIVEFEKIVPEESMANEVHTELNQLMEELGLVELDQGRLTRMFNFYNEHWPEYYGTDKTFNIE